MSRFWIYYIASENTMAIEGLHSFTHNICIFFGPYLVNLLCVWLLSSNSWNIRLYNRDCYYYLHLMYMRISSSNRIERIEFNLKKFISFSFKFIYLNRDENSHTYTRFCYIQMLMLWCLMLEKEKKPIAANEFYFLSKKLVHSHTQMTQ